MANPHNPNLVASYGQAMATWGLVVQDGVSGYGLETFGFLFEGPNIWLDIQKAAPITTTWSAASGASITTTWTDATVFGLGSEYPI